LRLVGANKAPGLALILRRVRDTRTPRGEETNCACLGALSALYVLNLLDFVYLELIRADNWHCPLIELELERYIRISRCIANYITAGANGLAREFMHIHAPTATSINNPLAPSRRANANSFYRGHYNYGKPVAFVDLIAITTGRQDPGMTKMLSRLPEIWLSETNLTMTRTQPPSHRPPSRRKEP